VACLAAETFLLLEAMAGRLSVGSAILLHVAVLSAACLALIAIAPQDLAPHLLAISLATIAGPVGLIAGLVLCGAARRTGAPNLLADRWSAWASGDLTLDAGAQLAERIESGRALRLSHPQRGQVPQIMNAGSFAEKQWLLGIVAQKFHVDFKPTLDAALRDIDPGLRVQAAAIRSRLNDRAKSELRELLEIAADCSDEADTVEAGAVRMVACLSSDLLDAAEARRLRAAAVSYCEAGLLDPSHSPVLKGCLARLRWDGGDYVGALQAQPQSRTI
jgi:hypothetical protein